MDNKIFLGYVYGDRAIAEKVAKELQKQGIKITSPINRKRGPRFETPVALKKAIQDAQLTVHLISKRSLVNSEAQEMLRQTSDSLKPSMQINLEAQVQESAVTINGIVNDQLKPLQDKVQQAVNRAISPSLDEVHEATQRALRPMQEAAVETVHKASEPLRLRAEEAIRDLSLFSLKVGLSEEFKASLRQITDNALDVAGLFPESLALHATNLVTVEMFDALNIEQLQANLNRNYGLYADVEPREEDYVGVPVDKGNNLTITPLLKNAGVSPARADVTWTGEQQSVPFNVTPNSEEAVEGFFRFSLGHIVLGVMRFVANVVPRPSSSPVPTIPQVMHRYGKVFLSYSHEDQIVVKMMRKLYEQYPRLETFVDYEKFIAGDKWLDKAKVKIREADALQLFWSQNSAKSEAVEQEWRYAYNLPRDIIPVIWGDPKPKIPVELKDTIFEPIDHFIEHF